MIDCISKHITDFLLLENRISLEDIDVYKYGVELVISSGITFLITILCGLLLSNLFNAILFYLSLISLRHFTGGYHSNSYLKCNVVFVVVITACLIINRVLDFSCIKYYVLMVMTVCSIFIILIHSPIENTNKRIMINEKRKYKFLSLLTLLFHILVFVILMIMGFNSQIIIIADFAVAIAMIIGFYENRRRCKQDEKSKIDIS